MTQQLEAFLAYTLTALIAATASAGESQAAHALRAAAIATMLRDFAPRDAVEAMSVSQIITLRFNLDAACRDLGTPGLDLKLAVRIRAQTMSMSRLLHTWMRRREAQRKDLTAKPAKQPRRDEAPAASVQPPRPAVGPMKEALLSGTRPEVPPFGTALFPVPAASPAQKRVGLGVASG